MNLTELDRHSDVNEARLEVGLTVDQCLALCAVSQRTWYRWRSGKAPIWALRLILSQHGTLDRFGWSHWEIRRGVLYCNELHHRYHWEPVHLLLPLFGITDRTVLYGGDTDNVSPLREKEIRGEVDRSLYLPGDLPATAVPGPIPNCA